MREIVDKYFGDNWIITLFMGISVDLNVWWEPYKAARAALKNINQPNIVKGLSDRFYKQFADLKPIIKEYLLEGVLNEDFILLKLPVILGHVRDGNTILKWLLLHRTTSNKKTKELVMSNVSDDSVLEFLLDLSQFEYQLKRILESVLSKRKDSWDRCLTEALDRIEELSDYFSGDKPLTKVKKDENLQKWFKDMAEKVRALAYENALVSGRKMQTIATAIENLEQFHQIEANIHIKKFLIDIRDYLNRMIRIVNVKPATMGQLSVICDFAYGWEIVQSQSYKGIMQRKVRENPRLCLFFRATFLKMVSIMEVPLVRIQQCGSDDSISVAAYYSSKLVAFIRSILQILPQSMFDTLNRIVQIQTQNIKDLPMKIELNDLHIHAKLEERYNLAKATHEVSLFTEGILEMKTTFVGIISVDPRDLLEQGIRKELVRQLSSALNDILSFKTDKVGEFEGCLRALAQKMIGFQRSFEYIQDYVNLYGLKVLQEELYRIINFYLEQESNLFLKKKIQPFESIYQSEAIPIPEFTPKDKFSITFLGRLVRQLALLTDPKKSVYISDRQGWFGIDGKEVVGIKTFDLLSNSLGVFGLNGIDRLVSFMIVQDMNKITSTFERTILKSAENMSFYDELSKELFPFSRNLDNPEKVYNSAMSKLEKIHSINDMIDWISSIGQKQLIRMQIQNELFFSCKIDSKLLFSSLEAFNNGLLMDIKSHYRNPDKTPYPNPETNPLLSEVNNYLEAGGMTSPLGKIYITCDPLYNFPTYLCILTLWEIPKLYWSASLGLTHKSRKDGKLDGAVFIIGLCTVLKQFHPSYTETYVALLSQYAKNIIQSNSEK
jgi:WASH complex subunit strumpellin